MAHPHIAIRLSVTCHTLSEAHDVTQRLTAALVGIVGEGYPASLEVWPEIAMDEDGSHTADP